MAGRSPKSKAKNEIGTRREGVSADQSGNEPFECSMKSERCGPEIGLSAMQTFTFGQRAVRAVEKDGRAWFVAKDVCDVLGIVNSRAATENLEEDEKGVGIADTKRGKRTVGISARAAHFISSSARTNRRQESSADG